MEEEARNEGREGYGRGGGCPCQSGVDKLTAGTAIYHTKSTLSFIISHCTFKLPPSFSRKSTQTELL